MMVEYVGPQSPVVHIFRDDVSNRDVAWFGVALKHPLHDQPMLLDDRFTHPDGVWYFGFQPESVLYAGPYALQPEMLQKLIPRFLEAHRG